MRQLVHDTRVVIAAVLVIVLTLGASIGGSWWVGLNAGRQATRSAASTVQLCEAGNEARAQQVGLWEYVATISKPPPHETPAQERARLATIRAFIAHVRKVFAPRNCNHPNRTEAPK